MKIYAAMHDDSQQGWIWLRDVAIPSHAIVRIRNKDTKHSVYCEALQIDRNFLHKYNEAPRITISNPDNVLVINGWYRAKLGGIDTGSEIDLSVETINSLYGRIRACQYHPQNVVRIATWLGVSSVALGVFGLILGVIGLILGVR